VAKIELAKVTPASRVSYTSILPGYFVVDMVLVTLIYELGEWQGLYKPAKW